MFLGTEILIQQGSHHQLWPMIAFEHCLAINHFSMAAINYQATPVTHLTNHQPWTRSMSAKRTTGTQKPKERNWAKTKGSQQLQKNQLHPFWPASNWKLEKVCKWTLNFLHTLLKLNLYVHTQRPATLLSVILFCICQLIRFYYLLLLKMFIPWIIKNDCTIICYYGMLYSKVGSGLYTMITYF